MTKKLTLGVALAAAVAAILPALGQAHATVTAFSPSGAALTGARTEYVLRVPNERADRATFRFTMKVPQAVQTAISVLYMPGYSVKLTRVDTGAKSDDGSPIMATTAITWLPSPGALIMPGFYGSVYFRFQNPITPQKLCFPVQQYYGGKINAKTGKASGKGELVNWTGATGSATPASCVDVVAATS